MKKNYSRRDALKIFGAGAIIAGGGGAGILATKAEAKSLDLSPKVAIISGGLGGITISTSILKQLPKAEVSIFDKDETFYYQPSFTLIAARIYNLDDVKYDKKELINEKVQWIKQNIAKINPESNTIQTESGESFDYDILVIATGVVYEFESIKGLIQEIVDVSAPNIATIYTPQSSLKAQKLVQKIAK